MSLSKNNNNDGNKEIKMSTLLDYVIGEKKHTYPIDLRSRPIKNPSLFYAPEMEPVQKYMAKATESCLVRTVVSCGLGAVVGLGFGLFTASVDPNITGQETPTFKNTVREMRIRMVQMSKNFAFIGAIFSGTECVVDTVRGKSELMNGTIAGGITGFLLGYRAGFGAALWSAGGFAIFSTIVDYYFRY